MEEVFGRRRRFIIGDRGEALEDNPVAADLPQQSEDALGQPARERDEVRAGADNDLMVALEPAYQAGLFSEAPRSSAMAQKHEQRKAKPDLVREVKLDRERERTRAGLWLLENKFLSLRLRTQPFRFWRSGRCKVRCRVFCGRIKNLRASGSRKTGETFRQVRAPLEIDCRIWVL